MNSHIEKKKLKRAFKLVKADIMELNKHISEFETEKSRNIRLNLTELKNQLADGTITACEFDQRYKRVIG